MHPLKSERAGQTSPRLLSQLPLLHRRKLGTNSDRILCQPHPQSSVYLIIQFLLLKLMATLLDVPLRAHETHRLRSLIVRPRFKDLETTAFSPLLTESGANAFPTKISLQFIILQGFTIFNLKHFCGSQTY